MDLWSTLIVFQILQLGNNNDNLVSFIKDGFSALMGDRATGCPWSFLQTSIFNVQPHVQRDHNSNEIFVLGSAHCAAPMTEISLLLWSFCAGS